MLDRLNKIISIIIVVVFTANSLGYAEPAVNSQQVVNSLYPINIPESYGRIENSVNCQLSTVNSQERPLVVLVKDAHCHYEAQRNIAKILDILIRDYKIDLICIEGATGRVNPSIIAGSPDKKRRKEVADRYLKKGWLTASEVLAMEKGRNYGFSIWGVEDLNLYLNDLIAFRDVYKDSGDAERFIGLAEDLVSGLKNRLYPPDLLEYDENIMRYRKNTISLSKLIEYLYGIDKDSFNRFKDLRLVLQALTLEKATDFNKVEDERLGLIRDIEKRSPKEEIQGLVRNSLLYKLGKISQDSYYSYLKRFISPEDLTKYENLYRYIKVVKLHSRIDEGGMFNELNALIEEIYGNYIDNEIAKKLFKIDRYIYHLGRLLRLEITRDEIIEYKKSGLNPFGIVEFLNVQGTLNNINIPFEFSDNDFIAKADECLKNPLEFYGYAIERDSVLIENLVSKMGEEGKDKAVLIIGGFHADGAGRLLREKGIEVITITPSITKEDTDAKRIYLSRMMDERIHPEEILSESNNQNLAAGVLSAEVWRTRYADIIDRIQNESLRGILQKSGTPEEAASELEKFKGELDEADIRVVEEFIGRIREAPGASTAVSILRRLIGKSSLSSIKDKIKPMVGSDNWPGFEAKVEAFISRNNLSAVDVYTVIYEFLNKNINSLHNYEVLTFFVEAAILYFDSLEDLRVYLDKINRLISFASFYFDFSLFTLLLNPKKGIRDKEHFVEMFNVTCDFYLRIFELLGRDVEYSYGDFYTQCLNYIYYTVTEKREKDRVISADAVSKIKSIADFIEGVLSESIRISGEYYRGKGGREDIDRYVAARNVSFLINMLLQSRNTQIKIEEVLDDLKDLVLFINERFGYVYDESSGGDFCIRQVFLKSSNRDELQANINNLKSIIMVAKSENIAGGVVMTVLSHHHIGYLINRLEERSRMSWNSYFSAFTVLIEAIGFKNFTDIIGRMSEEACDLICGSDFRGIIERMRREFSSNEIYKGLLVIILKDPLILSLALNTDFISNMKENAARYLNLSDISSVDPSRVNEHLLRFLINPSSDIEAVSQFLSEYIGVSLESYIKEDKFSLLNTLIKGISRLAPDKDRLIKQLVALEKDARIKYLTILSIISEKDIDFVKMLLGIDKEILVKKWQANLTILELLFNVYKGLNRIGLDKNESLEICRHIIICGERGIVNDLNYFIESFKGGPLWELRRRLEEAVRIFIQGIIKKLGAVTKKNHRILRLMREGLIYVTPFMQVAGSLRDQYIPILTDYLKADITEESIQGIHEARDSFIKKLFSDFTGLELSQIPERIYSDKAVLPRIVTIMTVCYSLTDGEYKEVAKRMRDLIKLYIHNGADDEKIKDIILGLEGNKKEIERLTRKTPEGRRVYDKRLWTKGIDIRRNIGALSDIDRIRIIREQINRVAQDLIPIAREVGYTPEGVNLSEYVFDTQEMVESFISGMENRLSPSLKSLVEDIKLNVSQIIEGAKSKQGSTAEEVRIIIRKDLLDEAYAGVGVPGCYNPVSGSNKQQPLVHALEANAFFVRIYNGSGQMFANAVITLTDNGVVVYASYSSRSDIDMDRIWLEAWKELSKYTGDLPIALIGAKHSAGFESAGRFGSKAHFEAVKKDTVWGFGTYYDFFTRIEENGDVYYNEEEATLITKESLGVSEGIPEETADADKSKADLRPTQPKARFDKGSIVKELFSMGLDIDLGKVIANLESILGGDETAIGDALKGLMKRTERGTPADPEEVERLRNKLMEIRRTGAEEESPDAAVVDKVAEAKAKNAEEGWIGRKNDRVLKVLDTGFDRKHVVIGDVHGEEFAVQQNLRDAGLVDVNGNWIGGNSVVVQIGDVIDRGPASYEVDIYLRELQRQAREAGGDVIRILGNHELNFVGGVLGDTEEYFATWILNLKYDKEKKGINYYDVLLETQAKYGNWYLIDILAGEKETDNPELKKWAILFKNLLSDIQSGNILMAYAKNNVLFVHGGIGRIGLQELDCSTAEKVAEALNDRLKEDFNVPYVVVSEVVNEACNERKPEKISLPFLEIVGHTQGTEVRLLEGGNVVNVDVGQTNYYYGNRGYVVIEGRELRGIDLRKAGEEISEEESPDAAVDSGRHIKRNRRLKEELLKSNVIGFSYQHNPEALMISEGRFVRLQLFQGYESLNAKIQGIYGLLSILEKINDPTFLGSVDPTIRELAFAIQEHLLQIAENNNIAIRELVTAALTARLYLIKGEYFVEGDTVLAHAGRGLNQEYGRPRIWIGEGAVNTLSEPDLARLMLEEALHIVKKLGRHGIDIHHDNVFLEALRNKLPKVKGAEPTEPSVDKEDIAGMNLLRRVISQLRYNSRPWLFVWIPGLTKQMEELFRTGAYTVGGHGDIYELVRNEYASTIWIDNDWEPLGLPREPTLAQKREAYEAYEAWRSAQLNFQEGDLEEANRAFEKEFGQYGIRILNPPSSGAIYYMMAILRLMPEGFLERGKVSIINFTAGRDKDARLSSYDKDTGKIGLIARHIDRYMLTGYLLHEFGHAVMETLNKDQKRALTILYGEFRRNEDAIITMDVMGSRDSRIFRTASAGEPDEFFAENFMHFIILGRAGMVESGDLRYRALRERLYNFYDHIYRRSGFDALVELEDKSPDASVDSIDELLENLAMVSGIPVEEFLSIKDDRKLVQVLTKLLMQDGEVSEEELKLILNKAELVAGIFKMTAPEVQEQIVMYLVIKELEKQVRPEFVNKLVKELTDRGAYADMAEGLVMELYNYNAYDDYFVLMLDGIRNMFGIEEGSEADKYLKMLDEYKSRLVQIKVKLKAPGVEFVSEGDKIYNAIKGYLERRNKDVVSQVAEIAARYLINKEEILGLFKDGNIKRKVEEGITTLISRKELDKIEKQTSAISGEIRSLPRDRFTHAVEGYAIAERLLNERLGGDFLNWDTSSILVADAVYIAGGAEGGFGIMKNAGEGLRVLYTDPKQIEPTKARLKQRGIEVKDAQFIDIKKYKTLTKGIVVSMLSHETKGKIDNIPENHRVIKGTESGEDDLMLMSRMAVILGRKDLKDTRVDFEKLLKTYYADTEREGDIKVILDGIMQSIESGVEIIIQLPPIAPYLKAYYNTLKTTRETIGSAA